MVLPICAGTSLKANLAKKQFKMSVDEGIYPKIWFPSLSPRGTLQSTHRLWVMCDVSTCTVRVYYTYNVYARRWKAHMTTELRQERWG